MSDTFECALCRKDSIARPWSSIVDLCDKCYAESRSAMTPEDRKLWQETDWNLLTDEVDVTYGPGMPRNKWASAYEWDFTQAVTQ